jgi:hypothetical protein
MRADGDQIVADYLSRLRDAASVLPADRGNELIEEITAHIAEARAEGPTAIGDASAVRNILERLGDPADIVRTAAEPPFGAFSAGPPASGFPESRHPESRMPESGYPGVGRAGGGHAESGYAGTGPLAWPNEHGGPGGHGGGSGPGSGPGGGPGGPGGGRAGALEITAVIFLLIGGVVIPFVGWVVGVILLWYSPRWRRSEKLLGTLVWPGGLLAPVLLMLGAGVATVIPSSGTSCSGGYTETGMTSTGRHFLRHVAGSCSTTGGGLPTWLAISLTMILLIAAIAGPIFTAIRLLRRAGSAPAEPAADPAALLPV